MLRIVGTAIRDIAARTNVVNITNSLISKQLPVVQCIQHRYFGAFSSTIDNWKNIADNKQKAILGQTQVNNVVLPTLLPTTTSVRTLTKFSRQKGKRASVKAVIDRFYRLNNRGIWIRTRTARNRKLWKKSARKRHKLKQHVFCNASQSALLDKMVTRYWKRRHYYVDDPYNPYHLREEFPFTRKYPKPC
ncbi:PREDICTED: 39S ribosomal protein L35, mitochondrial [Habropoda laboriosa]|uniref:39S ribosomal protein L35, mitochondrial n=1 Tax=Habropoda laboriosa TaxID=597456 RepID=UPI00083E4B28|nr:PREDICTED: 39S ribosomal protein L35, mitochondrial [Habropoda laboriosa]